MADASTAMTAIGGASKAYGSYEAGKYNRDANRYNATVAELQADQALQAGEQAKGVRDIKLSENEGTTRAALAAGGTVVGAGTNRAVLASEEGVSAMDKLMIDINARRRAFGYKVAAANFGDQAGLASRTANQNAVGTLLDTTASMERQHERLGRVDSEDSGS